MCSPFGIRDFPILNSVPVTPTLNASIYEEIPLDIQWGPKATEPSFIYDGTYADMGFTEYFSSDPSTTTLRLNGNSFNLLSVQICAPKHTSLLPEDKQRDCSGEIILSFRAQNKISESYLLLCIPILTRSTTSPSIYLEALRTGRLDGKPTSLLSVVPKDQHYISYSTCLQKQDAKGTYANQVRVFVFTEGLLYPQDAFGELVKKTKRTGAPYLHEVVLPDGLRDKSQALLFSIATETDYKSFLRYSQYYPQGQPDSSQYRTDELNSYKCVPLEPSKNIRDGKLVVDTESGELLSEVLKEDDTGKSKRARITPAMIEKIIAFSIALIILTFVLLVLAYILSNMVTPNADNFFGVIKQNTGSISAVVFFSTLAGVVCFVLGVFLTTLL
jgi:hypothetical protein